MNLPIHFVAIGSELLVGKIRDLNGFFLGEYLSNCGSSLCKITILKDHEQDLKDFFQIESQKKQFLILSGGLGPTRDDKTKMILSEIFDSPLIESQETLAQVQIHYERIQKTFAEIHNGYHYIPKNWTSLYNPTGLAPGLFFEKEGFKIFALPGVPREFSAMIKEHLPQLYSFTHCKTYQLQLRVIGVSEEELFFKKAPTLWDELEKMGEVSCLPNRGYLDISVTGENLDEPHFDELMKMSLPGVLFYKEKKTIPRYLVDELIKRDLTMVTAESCTGGLCAHLVTQISGASQIIKGGIITYQEQVKVNQLNVSKQTIDQYSVYSHEVAIEMAQNARQKFQSDIAISTTGIAGPSGGSNEHPVGTVFIGIDINGVLSSYQKKFHGNREELQEYFAHYALSSLLQSLYK